LTNILLFIAVMLGFAAWYSSLTAIGERFRGENDGRSTALPIVTGALGLASVVPMAMIFVKFDGSPGPFSMRIISALAMYSLFGVGAFLSGYGLLRAYILVRHGRAALERHDVQTSRRMQIDDATWVDLHHGELGEELRMKRYQAYLASQAEAEMNEEGKP
jgi:hypothetical protein